MSLLLRILQIDVPAVLLDEVTSFWAGVLDATPVQAPGAFVHLHHPRSAVEVHIQQIDDGPAGYHLDLEARPSGHGAPGSERATEVARLVDAGATQQQSFDEGYTVVRDPAGLALCVIDPAAAERNPLGERRDDRGYLDGIFLDVPAQDLGPETRFWELALDVTSGVRSGAYVPLEGVAGPGGPVNVEVQSIEGRARVHVDLSAIDVAAEAARLEALGARWVGAVEDWVTLADPAGNLFCVVPR